MNSSGLQLSHLAVGFGKRAVLRDVTLSMPERGMSVLVGAVASGKSTLVRTLAGLNHAQPELQLSGSATWAGQALFAAGGAVNPIGVSLVMQKARFFVDTVRETLVSALPNRSALDRVAQSAIARKLLQDCGLEHLSNRLELEVVELSAAEQRHLAIVRALASNPKVLLADEPTAGLEPEPARAILATLRAEASRRCVVLVTHNQEHARAAGGSSHLLVEGRIEESTPTEDFFTSPRTSHGQRFVRTGGCMTESAGELESQPPPADRWLWPRGFLWLIPGQIGGLPRPGILGNLSDDLRGLSRLGVRLLIGLEQQSLLPPDRLSAHGLSFVHFPTPDMQAPRVVDALRLCTLVERSLAQERPVAFHCRAGLGRTGTMLACQLVWRGRSVAQAIDTVRGLNPLCIQSQSQVTFLREFESARNDKPCSA
ncbi:MAG TPA: ATP-binding cassette domain-containing protein [Polyangiaceae bacterium]|nr:ATP-binding cassette domain-containing protein [Polyangiaceae bacterium]